MASITRSYAKLSLLLVCLASLANLAATQAPGDRDERCSRVQYEARMEPLMDTRDYGQLLPLNMGDTGGVWQVVDEDSEDFGITTWEARGRELCQEIDHVCGRDSTPQENWMITQHISHPYNVATVQVMVASTLEGPCGPSDHDCVEDLSLYVWETSAQDNVSAADTSNYRFVSNVSSGEVTIELSGLNQAGFYLGMRDNGTCVSVSRVLVYYSVCRAGAVGLVRVDQERVSGDSVQGHCAVNSVSNTPPQLQCLQSGEWKVIGSCQCETEYFLDAPNQQCLKSPSAPVYLRVSDITNHSLTLSWSHPSTDGTDTTDIHYNVSYGDKSVREVEVTQLNLTGLTPFFTYTLSVTAENSVSWQDPDTAGRTASIMATTLEGVAAQVVEIEIREGNDVFISWLEPRPPHGRILHYNIRIIQSGRETIIKEYNKTSISWDTWTSDWKISTSENVKIQIQAETAVGKGEYSQEKEVFPPTIIGSSDNSSESSSVSNELLIVGILVPLLVLLLLLIAIILIVKKIVSSKKTNQPPPPNSPFVNDIEEYASIKLSPSDPTFKIAGAPPIPRSPRPQGINPRFSNNPASNNHSCTGEDPTYHVLEDSTQGTDGNPYSLDPNNPTQVFGEPHISTDNPVGSRNECSASGGGGQERVYFELEDPHNSSVIKQRSNRNPTYESVGDNGVYWNEGLGPDQPKTHVLTGAIGRPGVLVSGSTITTSGAGPAYLEVVAPPLAE